MGLLIRLPPRRRVLDEPGLVRSVTTAAIGSGKPHLLVRHVTCTVGEVGVNIRYQPRGLVVPLRARSTVM